MESLYCTLFVEGQYSHRDMIGLVENELNSIHDKCYVYGNAIQVFVDQNKDADIQQLDRDDGFLFFSFRLEVEPLNTALHKYYKNKLLFFVYRLRSRGLRVVPSCDFEEFLNSNLPDADV